jgi:Ca2+/Na+ antiporter
MKEFVKDIAVGAGVIAACVLGLVVVIGIPGLIVQVFWPQETFYAACGIGFVVMFLVFVSPFVCWVVGMMVRGTTD